MCADLLVNDNVDSVQFPEIIRSVKKSVYFTSFIMNKRPPANGFLCVSNVQDSDLMFRHRGSDEKCRVAKSTLEAARRKL